MGHGQRQRVALVGLDELSVALGMRVLDAGYPLVVWGQARKAAAPLEARGARWAEGPGSAAKEADVVLTRTPGVDDDEDLYLGTDGVLMAAPVGSWLIDLSPSSPRLARELHDAAESLDKHAFDCPPYGNAEEAKAGTAQLLAGIDEAKAAPVAEVLAALSSRVSYLGKPGAGQVTLLCASLALTGALMGCADALALAQQEEVDVAGMLDAVSGGIASSGALERLAPLSLVGDYKGTPTVAYLRGQIALAREEAGDLELTLPGAETGVALLETLADVGGSQLGAQALTLLYADEAEGVAAGLDFSSFDEG